MNIGSLLTLSAQNRPANLAVVQGTYQLNYKQFNARVNRLCNGLQRRISTSDGNVAILMYNCPAMLEAMFAAFKAGFGVVPINFRLHPNEFSFIINDSEAEVLIVSPEFNEQVTRIRGQLPRVRHFITTAGSQEEDWLDYESLLASEPDDFEDVPTAPDDVAWLFYTSGTTGVPKGAMLTHQNLFGMTERFYSDLCHNFGHQEVMLHVAPLSHGSGLYALPNIGRSASHIFPETASFDPELTLRLIDTHHVTNLFAAPAMIRRLIESPAIDHCNLNSLKAFVYGGAPMMVEDLKKSIGKFGKCLVQIYGLGETPMTITYLPQEDHRLQGSSSQLKRLASAGVARTDVDVAIVNEEDRFLETGELGEVVTRSDVMMKGYWKNPEANAQALRHGWLHTGDVGYFDDDGYLFLMDRSKDMIISGGENIYPREIEEVIIQHPAIREVAVIGIPDEQWGESVKAIAVLAPGQQVDEDELISFCQNHIASYKKPKSVDFVAELPKNNYGKIVKRELRAPYWKREQREI